MFQCEPAISLEFHGMYSSVGRSWDDNPATQFSSSMYAVTSSFIFYSQSGSFYQHEECLKEEN